MPKTLLLYPACLYTAAICMVVNSAGGVFSLEKISEFEI